MEELQPEAIGRLIPVRCQKERIGWKQNCTDLGFVRSVLDLADASLFARELIREGPSVRSRAWSILP